MKKLVLIALLGVLAPLLVGLAPSAQAYPELQFRASVNKQVVHGSDPVTGRAVANVHCDWTIEWNGNSVTGKTLKKFATTFKAPDVKNTTVIPMHFTCAYDADEVNAGSRVAVNATWSRTINVTVLPRVANAAAPASGGSANMPNTGGPNLMFLLGGLLLLLVGVAAVAVARRRTESLELDPSRA